MKTYKGFYIDEMGIVRNAAGFRQFAVNNLYPIAGEKMSIEQLQDKINGTATQLNVAPNVTRKQDKRESVTRKVEQLNKTIENVKARKGKSNGNSDGVYIINGKRYESARAASQETKIRLSTLTKLCKLGLSFEPY